MGLWYFWYFFDAGVVLWHKIWRSSEAYIQDGPKKLAMEEEVFWEKPWWNWEFRFYFVSFWKILWWTGTTWHLHCLRNELAFYRVEIFYYHYSMKFKVLKIAFDKFMYTLPFCSQVLIPFPCPLFFLVFMLNY